MTPEDWDEARRDLERELDYYRSLTEVSWKMNAALRAADAEAVQQCLTVQESLVWELGRLERRRQERQVEPDVAWRQAAQVALAQLAEVTAQNAVMLREGLSILRQTVAALAALPGPRGTRLLSADA